MARTRIQTPNPESSFANNRKMTAGAKEQHAWLQFKSLVCGFSSSPAWFALCAIVSWIRLCP
jgi:hypothetical protein